MCEVMVDPIGNIIWRMPFACRTTETITHTYNHIQYVLLSDGKNINANAPQYYIILILLAFIAIIIENVALRSGN
jgi:hypothetical protein